MTSPRPNPWVGILPWLLAGATLFGIAAIGGFGAAYLVTTAQAVPTVDPQKLPTPSARPTPTPGASAPAPSGSSVSGTPTAPPSASVIPTATGSAAPTASSNTGPSPTPLSYVVQRGDHLSAIAAQFGVSVDAIVQLNNIKNPDHIEAGQVLLIPVAP